MLAVVAPDKFKGSLTARQVADALAAGLMVRPDVRCVRVPVADGGDGTVDAAVAAGWIRVPISSIGPTGEPVASSYAIRGRSAIIELASICGLSRLPDNHTNPLGAHTTGLGVAIRHALKQGATDIVIGLGGSASTDGGAGMLRALGARITDVNGNELPDGGSFLTQAHFLDLTAVTALTRHATFRLACDVDNPLLGPSGAAVVYGPQKGATPADVTRLETAVTTWARIVTATTGRNVAGLPAAGAAGGTAFAAMAVLGATNQSGVDLVLDLIGFVDCLDEADLVITGEGSLDTQSLRGKAPIGVAAAARTAGVPAIAVAGRSDLDSRELAAAGFARCYTLVELEPSRERAMRNASALLRHLGARIANEYREQCS